MEDIHKKILAELDRMIDQAPDVDMPAELQHFVENHYKVLADQGDQLQGVVAKLLLVNAICEFQHGFMVGADVSKHVTFLLQLATTVGNEKLVGQFTDEKRMEQMSKILEQKSLGIMTEGRKKLAS
jgi:hypothetical protein